MDTPGEYVPRFLATSQSDLTGAMENGTVRKDLYYRLSGATTHVPSLRERVDDIPLLTEHFLGRIEQAGSVIRSLSEAAAEIFRTYSWPGNVRELRNLVERITILSSNESKQKINQLIDDILNPSSKILEENNILTQSFQSPLKESREYFEKEYLTTQLKKHH